MKNLILIFSIFLISSCATSTQRILIDGVPHIRNSKSFLGIRILESTEPIKSVTEATIDTLALYGTYGIIGGIVGGIISFAFSAAIKSYTGQEFFNGLILASGCAFLAGIAMVMTAAWWWYIVGAIVTVGIYIGAKKCKDTGLF